MLSTTKFLMLFSMVNCQNDVLDNLDINQETISVSGFSSGACFATQFHTAFSASVIITSHEIEIDQENLESQIQGVGSVSGAPYLSMYEATDLGIIDQTLILAAEGVIDPVDNIKHDNVYIFQGLLDTITPWGECCWRN